MAPFAHVMALADRRERWPRIDVPISKGTRYFHAMRRSEAEP
jgi:hypothetical protein